MYIINMKEIVGIHILHAQQRNRVKPFFYGGHYPSWDKGSGMILILNGTADFKIDGRTYRASKRNLVLWDPAKLELFMPNRGKPLNYFILSMNMLSPDGKLVKFSDLDLPNILSIKSGSRIQKFIAKIFEIFRQKARFSTEKCSIIALELITNLLLLSKSKLKNGSSTDLNTNQADSRVVNVLTYLAENYKTSPKLKDLAEIAGVHPIHLIRLFKQATGTTPHNYIIDRKIEKAMDYLKLYKDQPSAMNLEFNFHDQSHFYRTFKKRTGLTPTEYIHSNKSF